MAGDELVMSLRARHALAQTQNCPRCLSLPVTGPPVRGWREQWTVSGDGAWRPKEWRSDLAGRYMRIRNRNDGARVNGNRQADVGSSDSYTAAAVHVHVLAGLIARGRFFVADGVIGVDDQIMIVSRVAMRCMVSMRVRIERRQHRRIAVQAARAQGGGNHDDVQDLAGR